jgi:hypothetical protein
METMRVSRPPSLQQGDALPYRCAGQEPRPAVPASEQGFRGNRPALVARIADQIESYAESALEVTAYAAAFRRERSMGPVNPPRMRQLPLVTHKYWDSLTPPQRAVVVDKAIQEVLVDEE